MVLVSEGGRGNVHLETPLTEEEIEAEIAVVRQSRRPPDATRH